MHCSFRNAKDNVVIVLLMCLRHNGRCTTTAVSLVWVHHEFSMPACHNDMKSENGFFAVHHVKLPQHSWRIFLVMIRVMQEKKDIALALQRIDTYFTLKLMLIFPPVLRQQMQLFKTANCASAKSLKCLEQRMWNISVTNGFENTQPLQSNGWNLCSPSLPRQNKAKQKKGQLAHVQAPAGWIGWFQSRTLSLSVTWGHTLKSDTLWGWSICDEQA